MSSVPLPHSRRRWLVAGGIVTTAVLLLGCGAISQARQVVEAASVLSDFADRMEGAGQLTYTATYEVDGGLTTTLVQDPPKAAWSTGSQSIIFTEEHILVCQDAECQRTLHQSSDVRGAEAGLVGGMMGPGFVTPEMALGLVALAAIVPGAKINRSDRTIADQQTRCAEVTDLDGNQAADPGESMREFTVCITDRGILALFSGVSTEDQPFRVELVSFSDSADPAAFEPPAGATVTDHTEIPTPSE